MNLFVGQTLVCRLIIITGIFLVICSSVGQTAEFAPYGIRPGRISKSSLYSQQGAPDLALAEDCQEKEEGEVCWPVIYDGSGNELDRFATDSRLYKLAKARYRRKAYLLVKINFSCGDDRCRETYLYDDHGERTKVTRDWRKQNPLDLQITSAGNLLRLEKRGLTTRTPSGIVLEKIKFPPGADNSRHIKAGKIQNNLAGNQAVITIAGSAQAADGLWLSDGSSWWPVEGELAAHGDRRQIISVYPLSGGGAAGVFYRYVNVFNKGLYLIYAPEPAAEADVFPVYLAHRRNVGWDPDIFISGDTYYIQARDSSNDKNVRINIPRAKIEKRNYPGPSREQFPPGETRFSLFAGRGVMRRYWRGKSEVEAGGVTHARVDYNFDPFTMESSLFEGRIGNKRLVLNYLKQLGKDKIETEGGEPARKAADYLLGSISFDNFFSKSSGLRLDYRKQKTSGLAEITRKNYADTTREFSVKYSQIGLYNTRERGYLLGVEYTDYQLPSAVGFRDSGGEIVYSGFDPNFTFKKIAFVSGYDPRLYARRYETNYTDFFMAGQLGLGVGKADLSAAVKSKAKKNTGKNSIEYPLFLSADSRLETGYIRQYRSFHLHGLGVQILAGYRVEGSWMWAGTDDGASEEDELELEFKRRDVWHGPFVNINVVF